MTEPARVWWVRAGQLAPEVTPDEVAMGLLKAALTDLAMAYRVAETDRDAADKFLATGEHVQFDVDGHPLVPVPALTDEAARQYADERDATATTRCRFCGALPGRWCGVMTGSRAVPRHPHKPRMDDWRKANRERGGN